MPDIFDQLAAPQAAPNATPPPAAAPPSPSAAAPATGDIFDQLAAGTAKGPEVRPEVAPKPGFLETAGKDILAAGKSVLGMALAPDEHLKNAVSSLAAGNKTEAAQHFMNALLALSDPSKDIVDAQLKSSKDAGQRMIESAKAGDVLGAAQHAAGIVPVASQVDAAMTAYQKDPSRENLAHIVTASLPALLGIAAKGIAPAVKGIAEDVGTSEAGQAVGETVSKTAKAATAPLRTGAVQEGAEGIHQGIKNAMADVADEAGVAKPTAKSIAKTAENTADNVYAKSKVQYKTLDEATGGRVQRFKDRLDNIRRKLDSLTGTEEDLAQEEKLNKAQAETEDAMKAAFEDAKNAGVDPKLVDEATQNFKKSQALYDVDQAVKKSTSGMRPDVGNPKMAAKNPEIVDPEKFFNRINALHRSGRLEDALGSEGADNLLAKANQAVVQFRKIQKTQKIVGGAAKATAGAVGLGLAANKVREMIH